MAMIESSRVASDVGLVDRLLEAGYDFFTGVPDSGLAGFLADLERLPPHVAHVAASWEGEAVGIATGAWLAGRRPCVYLQNAGLGHTINPLTSLCIPGGVELLLIVGHRHTLPQHEVMGRVDEALLQLIGWDRYVIVDGKNNES
jgi:phosphonopyruvate decarboxylase